MSVSPVVLPAQHVPYLTTPYLSVNGVPPHPGGNHVPVLTESALPNPSTPTILYFPGPGQPNLLSIFMRHAQNRGLKSLVKSVDNDFYLFWQGDLPASVFSPKSKRLLKTFNAHHKGGVKPLVLDKAGCNGIGKVVVEVWKTCAAGLTLRHYCCASRVARWSGRYSSQYEQEQEQETETGRDEVEIDPVDSGYHFGSAVPESSTSPSEMDGDITLSSERHEGASVPTDAEDEDNDEYEVGSEDAYKGYEPPDWDDLPEIFDDIVWEGHEDSPEIDVSGARNQICHWLEYETLHPGAALEDDALALLDDVLQRCSGSKYSTLAEGLMSFENE